MRQIYHDIATKMYNIDYIVFAFDYIFALLLLVAVLLLDVPKLPPFSFLELVVQLFPFCVTIQSIPSKNSNLHFADRQVTSLEQSKYVLVPFHFLEMYIKFF